MTPYYTDDLVTLYHGDCLDVLAGLPDESVDAVITDPPYDMTVNKKGGTGEASPNVNSPAGRSRISTGGGFMGKEWDATGIAFRPDVWREVLRVLKPGGHLLAFGAPRTYHRMAVAIEDAGFEVRDSLMWLFGSGFPKSHDIGKAIDRAAGAEREVVGTRTDVATRIYDMGEGERLSPVIDITAPATPEAQAWDGWGTALKPAHEPVLWARKPFSVVPLGGEIHRIHHLIGALLWLSLSPAKRAEQSSASSPHGQHGAWCVSARALAATTTSPDESGTTDTFSSPEAGSTFWSIVSSWSAILGALSRPTSTSTTSMRSSTTTALRTLNSLLAPLTSPDTMPPCECLTHGDESHVPSAASSSTGAWAKWIDTLSASAPATAIAQIAPVVASLLADTAAQLSGDPVAEPTARPAATTGADVRVSPEAEPIILARKPLTGTVASNVLTWGVGGLNVDGCRIGLHPDEDAPTGSGAASAASIYSQVSTSSGNGGNVTPTKGRWPANVILDDTAAALLDQQSGFSTSPPTDSVITIKANDSIGTFKTKDRTMGNGHGDSGGASRFFYTPKADRHERPRVDGVSHPTVKPVDLMAYLVRLVTPRGGIVLDPFAGTGTTAEAATAEGCQTILIEREADYLPLIVQRLQRPVEVTLW